MKMAHMITCTILSLLPQLAVAQAPTRISEEPWGELADGRKIIRYTLTDANGARASFMALGAAILSVEAPDRSGKLADVALGYGKAADYNTGNSPQFGLTIGRYANRIASTRITIGTDSFSPFFRPFIAMSCSPRWRSPISELGHC